MNRILATAVVLGSLLSGRAFAADRRVDPGPVLSGTINVLVANDQGIVVLADSMLSQKVPDGHGGSTPRPLPDAHQKLFQIDERTVCVFAGFASAQTTEVPDFLNDTSAIMGRFEDSLRDRPLPTISEKMKLLEAIFSHYLTGVANLRESVLSEGDHTIELLLAGYDPDGTPRVATLILQIQPAGAASQGPLFDAVTRELKVVGVAGQGSPDMYATVPLAAGGLVVVHGQPELALDILQQPARWVSDPAVTAYANSKTQGKPLTIDQMKALAISLKQHTSEATQTVGGPTQLAVLTNGRVQYVDQPKFPPIRQSSFKFRIEVDNELDGPELPNGRLGYGALVGPGLFTLYFKNTFKRVEQPLDEAYFAGNVFRECRLVYNGGRLQFEDSNEVYDSDLILNVANRETPEVRHLLSNFKWRHVASLGQSSKSPPTDDQHKHEGK